MKLKFLFLFLFAAKICVAQMDTLYYGFSDDKLKFKSIENCPKIFRFFAIQKQLRHHKLILSFGEFEPVENKYDNSDGKNYRKNIEYNDSIKREYIKRSLRKVYRRATDLKVLVIMMPSYLSDSGKNVYPEGYCRICDIDFTKFKNLKTVYLIGDDSDESVQMPDSFYESSVKTIHVINNQKFDELKKNIQSRNKVMKVFLDENDGVFERFL
jgi:hypothetical protein